MNTHRPWRFVVVAHLALCAAGALVVACSGDDTVAPVYVQAKDAATTDSSSVQQGNDAAAAPDAGPQLSPPGCFAATPVESQDFMNACTTAAYVVFDNCARLNVCNGAAPPADVPPPKDAGVDASDAGGANDAASDDGSAADGGDAAVVDADTDGG